MKHIQLPLLALVEGGAPSRAEDFQTTRDAALREIAAA